MNLKHTFLLLPLVLAACATPCDKSSERTPSSEGKSKSGHLSYCLGGEVQEYNGFLTTFTPFPNYKRNFIDADASNIASLEAKMAQIKKEIEANPLNRQIRVLELQDLEKERASQQAKLDDRRAKFALLTQRKEAAEKFARSLHNNGRFVDAKGSRTLDLTRSSAKFHDISPDGIAHGRLSNKIDFCVSTANPEIQLTNVISTGGIPSILDLIVNGNDLQLRIRDMQTRSITKTVDLLRQPKKGKAAPAPIDAPVAQ